MSVKTSHTNMLEVEGGHIAKKHLGGVFPRRILGGGNKKGGNEKQGGKGRAGGERRKYVCVCVCVCGRRCLRSRRSRYRCRFRRLGRRAQSFVSFVSVCRQIVGWVCRYLFRMKVSHSRMRSRIRKYRQIHPC